MNISVIRGRIIEAGDCIGTGEVVSGEEVHEPGLIVEATRDELANGRNMLFSDVVVLTAEDFEALRAVANLPEAGKP